MDVVVVPIKGTNFTRCYKTSSIGNELECGTKGEMRASVKGTSWGEFKWTSGENKIIFIISLTAIYCRLLLIPVTSLEDEPVGTLSRVLYTQWHQNILIFQEWN